MKIAIVVAMLAIAGYVGWGIYAAGLDERPAPSPQTAAQFTSGEAAGRRSLCSGAGKTCSAPSWSAKYDRIVASADQSLLDLYGVHDGLIYKKGKPYLRVDADHMTVNVGSKDFSAIGKLHIETVGSKPSRSFDTTSAVWNNAQQTLDLTQRSVVRTSGDAPFTVGRLTVDLKSGDIDVHDVAGEVR